MLIMIKFRGCNVQAIKLLLHLMPGVYTILCTLPKPETQGQNTGGIISPRFRPGNELITGNRFHRPTNTVRCMYLT